MNSRIAHVVLINDFANANGGSAAIALDAAREYCRLGYRVTFICGDAAAPGLSDLGIETVSLDSRPLLQQSQASAFRKGLHDHSSEGLVADWISENDTPDTAYHVHSWAQILSPSIFAALRPVEARTIVTCHDFFNICPNGGFTHFSRSEPCTLRPMSPACLAANCDRRSYLHKGWRTLRHLSLNRSARFGQSKATFTFLHDRMRDRFVEAGFPAANLATVPNPVMPWSNSRIEAERNEGFLFVGRIGRDKGADLAIDAATAAGQHLTLVGTGELASAEYAKARGMTFAGWRDRGEIASFAGKARALIVPSRVVEPFGLVILEAAMSGLPVIVTSHAYLADDIVAMGCGMAFDLGKPRQLPAILTALAGDDRAIEQMSRAGFSQAASLCLDHATWIDTFVRLFEEKLAA